MLSLRAEIAVCLFAVSLIGLFAGWMLHRVRAARRLGRTVAALEARHAEIEANARRDVDNLEERLQSLGEELRALKAENRELRAGPDGGNDASLEAARAESIELNRRHVETQERLQRIIREREREIATLRAGLAAGVPHDREPDATADTAAGPETVGAEGLDETVRLDPALLPVQRSRRPADVRALRPVPEPGDARGETPDEASASLDETLESTVDVAFLDGEEATIALDEETLSLVRGLGRGGERKG